MIEAPADIEIATGMTETTTVEVAAATGRVKTAGGTGDSIADLSGPTGTLGTRTTGGLTDHVGTEGGS